MAVRVHTSLNEGLRGCNECFFSPVPDTEPSPVSYSQCDCSVDSVKHLSMHEEGAKEKLNKEKGSKKEGGSG